MNRLFWHSSLLFLVTLVTLVNVTSDNVMSLWILLINFTAIIINSMVIGGEIQKRGW